MTLINREIIHGSPIEFIEHKTGKRVKSWRKDPCRFITQIIFEDNTYYELEEGTMVDEIVFDEVVFKEIPKDFCASCGEDSHGPGYFNWKEQCEVTVKNFWEKVRKVYWHRYLRGKRN